MARNKRNWKTCSFCGKKFKEHLKRHLLRKHGLTNEEATEIANAALVEARLKHFLDKQKGSVAKEADEPDDSHQHKPIAESEENFPGDCTASSPHGEPRQDSPLIPVGLPPAVIDIASLDTQGPQEEQDEVNLAISTTSAPHGETSWEESPLIPVSPASPLQTDSGSLDVLGLQKEQVVTATPKCKAQSDTEEYLQGKISGAAAMSKKRSKRRHSLVGGQLNISSFLRPIQGGKTGKALAPSKWNIIKRRQEDGSGLETSVSPGDPLVEGQPVETQPDDSGLGKSVLLDDSLVKEESKAAEPTDESSSGKAPAKRRRSLSLQPQTPRPPPKPPVIFENVAPSTSSGKHADHDAALAYTMAAKLQLSEERDGSADDSDVPRKSLRERTLEKFYASESDSDASSVTKKRREADKVIAEALGSDAEDSDVYEPKSDESNESIISSSGTEDALEEILPPNRRKAAPPTRRKAASSEKKTAQRRVREKKLPLQNKDNLAISTTSVEKSRKESPLIPVSPATPAPTDSGSSTPFGLQTEQDEESALLEEPGTVVSSRRPHRIPVRGKKRASKCTAGKIPAKRRKVICHTDLGERTDEDGTESRRNENRSRKQCPYCDFSCLAKLGRHLLRKHQSRARTAQQAKEISERVTRQTRLAISKTVPVGKISEDEVGDIFGDTWSLDGVREKTLALLTRLNVQILNPEPVTVEESQQPMDEQVADEDPLLGDDRDEEMSASVKALMKKYGFYKKVPDDQIVAVKFAETRNGLGKNKRSTEHSVKRLRQIFAYAREASPTLSPWELLVDTTNTYKYLKEIRGKCGATHATFLTYVKDMDRALFYALNKWINKSPDVPNDDNYAKKLKEAYDFWHETQLQVDRKVKTATTENLATGKTKVADLEHLYEYLDGDDVKTSVEGALTLLEGACRYQTKLKITRKDTKLIEAWNLLCRYLMTKAIVENGCRTGVMQNMLIPEFDAAKKLRGKWIVLVANHKSVKTYGPAKVKISNASHAMYVRFAKIRKCMSVAKPFSKILFVSTGGQQYRDVTGHVNQWLKMKEYQTVTVNMIRKAIENAAAAQGDEFRTDVSTHLAHSVQTAESNYRTKDLDASVRAGDAVELCQLNHRALRLVLKDPQAFFKDDTAELPSNEILQSRFRELLRSPTMKLTEKTYSDIRDIWESELQ